MSLNQDCALLEFADCNTAATVYDAVINGYGKIGETTKLLLDKIFSKCINVDWLM